MADPQNNSSSIMLPLGDATIAFRSKFVSPVPVALFVLATYATNNHIYGSRIIDLPSMAGDGSELAEGESRPH
jgi:hypothetical protein